MSTTDIKQFIRQFSHQQCVLYINLLTYFLYTFIAEYK